MSAEAAEERTTPRDDPRFVVWGELLPSPTPARAASNSVSSNSSHHRKRRSGRPSAASTSSASSAKSSPANEMGTNGDGENDVNGGDAVHINGAPGEQEKVLLAATIERWLAQLTSALDYDELLVFFMTYRTFIAPLDCVQLLIARFWWGIGRSLDPPSPGKTHITTCISASEILTTHI